MFVIIISKFYQTKKAILCIWWCKKDVIYFKIVIKQTTFNAKIYTKQLQQDK